MFVVVQFKHSALEIYYETEYVEPHRNIGFNRASISSLEAHIY